MSFFKTKPYRDKKYREWVATLPCADCGTENETTIGHHLIGVGNGIMGGKASDLDLMSLCYLCHESIHLKTGNKQEQYKWISETLQQAIREGFKFKGL